MREVLMIFFVNDERLSASARVFHGIVTATVSRTTLRLSSGACCVGGSVDKVGQ